MLQINFSFIQSKLIGSNGFFSTRLKYLKSKLKETNSHAINEVANQLDELQIANNPESQEEALQFLKTCVIKNTEINILVEKLKKTQNLRESMMRDENIDLRESFPFFFVNPSLV